MQRMDFETINIRWVISKTARPGEGVWLDQLRGISWQYIDVNGNAPITRL